jgi:hypothetical protein
MLSPDDIERLCQRKYPAFLRAVVTGQPFFPLEIRFGRPSTTEEWEKLRCEISSLAKGNLGYRVEWTETNTRRWGRQKFPDRVWFEDELGFLKAVRKHAEVEQFRRNLALTREVCPALNDWLPGNVASMIEFSDAWADLLEVCRYFLGHPRPGLYARELPIAVDTKSVERHQGILRSLLDFLLPDSAKTEAERFEERFGLHYDEPLIRLRLLDPGLKRRLSMPLDDLSVPLTQFRALMWSGLAVLITENKMTFLTLPSCENALGIWGGGGAAELLTSVPWLRECRLFYWGDLDVHGFHILSRLRRVFPHLASMMMDETTLKQFRQHAVKAKPANYEDVSALIDEERRAYESVAASVLLLEQEKIPHAQAATRISELLRSRRA